MNDLRPYDQLRTVWLHVQRVLGVVAVLMLVLSPLAAHEDAHAADKSAAVSISVVDHVGAPTDTDDPSQTGCCHAVAGCAGIVLVKSFDISERVLVAAPSYGTLSEVWQSCQGTPDIKPPIL